MQVSSSCRAVFERQPCWNPTPFSVQTELPDPDASIVLTRPGISAKLGSSFYGNLEGWARGEFFPLAVRRLAVEKPTKRTQPEAHGAATE
jgi:hypothetical protein